jgi:hypothetical protein
MEKSIQDKINQIKKLADKPKMYISVEKERHNEDSLEKSIRNSKEANIFLSELKLAIDLASKKS